MFLLPSVPSGFFFAGKSDHECMNQQVGKKAPHGVQIQYGHIFWILWVPKLHRNVKIQNFNAIKQFPRSLLILGANVLTAHFSTGAIPSTISTSASFNTVGNLETMM